MAEISIVIPNFNGLRFLADCLGSLEMQRASAPEFDVIVVDNGSQDGSVALIERDWPQVQLIALATNTGFCHAVNVGIRASQTPYVILLNNDTKVLPGFVQQLFNAISQDEKIFSVSSCMLMWDRPELIDDAGDQYCALGWAYGRGKGKAEADYSTPKSVFSACGGASIYRKSVLNEIGLFDELHFAYLEDLDIGYRARIYGYENRYEPTARVIHYGSASTGSRYNPRKTTLASANSVYVIWKNMPLLQWIWNLPFLLPGFFLKFLFFCKKGMGRLYAQGLRIGWKRCFDASAKSQKVKFRWKNLGNYLRIQGRLYANLFRFIMKS